MFSITKNAIDFIDRQTESNNPFFLQLSVPGPFGVQFVMLFGVPGTLGNRLKTLKGIRFSHFGDPFCRYGFQARSGGGLFVDFHDF